MWKSLLIKITKNVLKALYQHLGVAIIIAMLFMFTYMYFQEHGIKNAITKFFKLIKRRGKYQQIFLLSFYSAMILLRTVWCRSIWDTPLSNVIGTWGLYNNQGEFTTEAIENLVLFIPFSFLLLCLIKGKVVHNAKILFGKVLIFGVVYAFCFSLAIELAQLFLKLGTFQYSDLFFNTIGGAIGSILFCMYHAIKQKCTTK